MLSGRATATCIQAPPTHRPQLALKRAHVHGKIRARSQVRVHAIDDHNSHNVTLLRRKKSSVAEKFVRPWPDRPERLRQPCSSINIIIIKTPLRPNTHDLSLSLCLCLSLSLSLSVCLSLSLCLSLLRRHCRFTKLSAMAHYQGKTAHLFFFFYCFTLLMGHARKFGESEVTFAAEKQ